MSKRRRHEPIGHRFSEPGPARKSGRELGVQLAEQWRRNVLAGNCRGDGASFEEWLPVAAGGDVQAEVAGLEHYETIRSRP